MKIMTSAAVLTLASGSLAGTINVPGDYTTIQAAINAAKDGDIVMVADGYYSGPGNANIDTLGKAITVRSVNGPEHTWILLEDYPAFNIHSGETDSTVIRGFGVEAEYWGVDGFICVDSSPLITGCQGHYLDTGLAATGSDIRVTDCSFYESKVAIRITGGSIEMSDCQIIGNDWKSRGVVLDSTAATITNCSISDNSHSVGGNAAEGAGIALYDTTATMVDCTISGNICGADYSGQGGGVYIDPASEATFSGCLIESNRALDHFGLDGTGGGVCAEGPATFSDCTIRNNSGASCGGVYATAPLSFTECSIIGNRADEVGGIAVIDTVAVFTSCTMSGNTAVGGWGYSIAGAAYVSGEAMFDACLFADNSVDSPWEEEEWEIGGAVQSDGAASFTNCIFSGNTQQGFGGGGALALLGSDNVVNCTFYNNAVSAGQGGAIHAKSGATVANSIFRANGPGPVGGETIAVSYSNVEGGYIGPGNLDADPLFIDPINLDFRLSPGSPCIDAGDNTSLPDGTTTDFGGLSRFQNDLDTADTGVGPAPVVDMGAHELPAPLDLCESAVLFAPGGQNSDFLGQAICMTGDMMIAGAFLDDAAGEDAGAAHIFTQVNNHWSHKAKLLSGDIQPGDFFGSAIAASGSAAVIGAPRADPAGASSGAAYIFRQTDGVWTQEAKLVPDDAAPLDQFGNSVALVGDTAVIGSWKADLPGKSDSGAAYIFARENGQWVQKARLTAGDASAGDQFGRSVTLLDGFAFAGAPGDDNAAGFDAGAAYIFHSANGHWTEQAKLMPPGLMAGDRLGFSIAAAGSRLVVGAPGSDLAATDAGAAYFYGYNGDWNLDAAATIANAQSGDAAGSSVALVGQLALVGAWMSDVQGADSGAAVLFEHDGKGWLESASLTGASIHEGDLLGASVAIGGGSLAAGAIHADRPGSADEGAVLVYSTTGCPCYPDFTADGLLDLFDFLAFVNAFNAGDSAADCTGEGTFDLFDFLCFVNSFNEGC